MHDPFLWSFPIGRLFGVTVRIHVLFPLVCLGLILRTTGKDFLPGTWIDATVLMGLLFLVVLLHEFGHCFAARHVGGEANEVLLWPLGGLAAVDVPHSARANFITAAGGPLVNLVICASSAVVLLFALEQSWRPPLNPFSVPSPIQEGGFFRLFHPDSSFELLYRFSLPVLFAQLFWVSWVLLLLNTLLIGYPLDGGRMFQCILWPHVGYRQATLYAVYAGFCTMFLLLLVSFIWIDPMVLLLAFFIYTSCRQQWLLLETGGEDSLFGYDFSQGYTSLEKDRPPPQPRRKQPNFLQRWLQRRAARRLLAEQQRQQEEECRMDQLLEKIQRFGKDSLTEEEHRFLKKVADRYRNRP